MINAKNAFVSIVNKFCFTYLGETVREEREAIWMKGRAIERL